MPQGLAWYVRRLSRRHGTPTEFAKRCFDSGLSWVALGGVWQEPRDSVSRRINPVQKVKDYAGALEALGIEPWVWGYPWMGHEEAFCKMMVDYGVPRILLDPELGANPERIAKGTGKRKADKHAHDLVELFGGYPEVDELGLSTFGSGWRIGWFPLLAYTKALGECFPGKSFIGGQTYTDDATIDRSIADMLKVIDKAKVDMEVVPNYGLYRWDTRTGRKTKGAKAKPKTAEQLRLHLYEFIDEAEPVDALIGWAENFATLELRRELRRFADMMARGACTLPAREETSERRAK